MYVAGNDSTHKYHPLEIQIFIIILEKKNTPTQKLHKISITHPGSILNMKVKDLPVDQAPVFV